MRACIGARPDWYGITGTGTGILVGLHVGGMCDDARNSAWSMFNGRAPAPRWQLMLRLRLSGIID